MESVLVISERNRPIWQTSIAALILTACFALVFAYAMQFFIQDETITHFAKYFYFSFYLFPIGIGFCSQKRVHVDIKNSRFRPTLEIGNLKFGRWNTIKNHQYVSVFYDPSKHESQQSEVNIWCDNNKHFELYAKNNFEDAMLIAYNLSEELNIDLLDATIKNNFLWIDKEELKQQTNQNAS